MYSSYKFSSLSLIAVVFALVLLTFGSPALQAKDKDNHYKGGCGCPAPVVQKPAPCCPAPVIHKAVVEPPPCCPLPVVRQKPCGPAPTSCCPVDPKQISKAEKEALHAQHEAAEACQRQQKAIAKAQHELDEEYARQQSKIEKRNAKLNRRVSEFAEANAKYDALIGGPSEAVAEVTPEPLPEPEVRSKPEPTPIVPEPTTQPTPAPVIEEKEVALVVVPTPPQATTPEPTKPKHLPKTASDMGLIGLVGLVSMTGYMTRFFRR
jgi:hypothetical protein